MSQIQTRQLSLEAGDQHTSAIFYSPEVEAPGILLLHSWWGLNDFFKSLSQRLAGEGFAVLAPDLNFGQVARTIPEAEELRKQEGAQTEAAALAAVRLLRAQPGVRAGKLGAVGFSMGADYSLLLAAAFPEEIGAVSLYYGAWEVDFSKTRAAFQGHFGETDEWTEMVYVRQIEDAMRLAGLEPEFYIYPHTGHWFIEDDRPDAYQPESARLAWERTVQFFKAHLF